MFFFPPESALGIFVALGLSVSPLPHAQEPALKLALQDVSKATWLYLSHQFSHPNVCYLQSLSA